MNEGSSCELPGRDLPFHPGTTSDHSLEVNHRQYIPASHDKYGGGSKAVDGTTNDKNQASDRHYSDQSNYSEGSRSPANDECDNVLSRTQDECGAASQVLVKVNWDPPQLGLKLHSGDKENLDKEFSLMGHVETAVMTNMQEEEEAIGGLINSDGEEVEWDPASLGEGHKQYSGLKDHQAALDKPENQTPGKHCCKMCGKEFSSRSGLCQHQKNHIEAKPHECVDCGKRFAYQNSLTIHLRTHTEEKLFPSPACGKTFSQQDDTSSRMKIRTNKPSLGTTSGKEEGDETVGGLINSEGEEVEWDPAGLGEGHKQYSGLKEHQTALDKPERHRENQTPGRHCCKACRKEFSSPSGLCQHEKNHARVKPHECVDCGKRFAYQKSLTIHRRTHAEGKSSACGKRVSRLGNARCRVKIHTKKPSGTAGGEEEEGGGEAVGGLINSDGEEVEWDPASCGE
ncbi:uncharacterized protein ACJ7VT_018024 [Polymixia lowei]